MSSVSGFWFETAARLREMEARLMEVWGGEGYREVVPPLLIPSREILDLVPDSLRARSLGVSIDGRAHWTLRSDFTPAVAALAARRIQHLQEPARIAYRGAVLRRPDPRVGEPEGSQAGCERISTAPGPEGDLEVAQLAAATLSALDASDAVLELGSWELVGPLIEALPWPDAGRDAVQGALNAKSIPSIERLAARHGGRPGVPAADRPGSSGRTTRSGGRAAAEAGRARGGGCLAGSSGAGVPPHRVVPAAGAARADRRPPLVLLHRPHGQGVLPKAPQGGSVRGEVRRGVRRARADVGGLWLRRSPGSHPRAGRPDPVKRIALTKGRLLEPTLDWLVGLGFERPDVSGRELSISIGRGWEAILLKGEDVTVFVEQGAADLGVVGADVLEEYEPDVYDLAELGFGRCRLSLAVPAAGLPDGAVLRVATKYPRLTRRLLAESGLWIRVIPISSSAELSPALGLADAIVDIVDSGKTLQANGLREERVLTDVQAHLVANRRSYRFVEDRWWE